MDQLHTAGSRQFKETCSEGMATSDRTPTQSTLYCGCDPGANYVCQRHRTEADKMMELKQLLSQVLGLIDIAQLDNDEWDLYKKAQAEATSS